jgi:aminopeptidase
LLYMERLNKGDLAWCVAQYPDDSDAQGAGMSLHEYEEFVFNACLLYKEDPVAEWKQFERRQIKLCEWLKSKKEFHIIAPDTDLFINCAGRPWVNCGGTNNLPDGEVFTSPIENYTHGRIKYTYPGEFLGKVVNGVWLEFEEGKIVRCGADDNAELVEKELNFDEGARILGEFAFGTNYNVQRHTMNTLFDEKIGGTLHLAHGMAYAEAGGTNESMVHHDLILNLREQGEVWADGELIYKRGRFLLEY